MAVMACGNRLSAHNGFAEFKRRLYWGHRDALFFSHNKVGATKTGQVTLTNTLNTIRYFTIKVARENIKVLFLLYLESK